MRAPAPLLLVLVGSWLCIASALVGACGAGNGIRQTRRRGTADEQVTHALTDAVKLIRASRFDDAERRLAEARSVAFEDPDLLERLDYYLATVMVYRGDLKRAQRLVGAHAQRAAGRGDSDSEAWMQSSASWLRWAAGDPLGAIAETERISRLIGAEGEIDALDRRALMLSHLWDRAFFLLDQAMTIPEEARDEALQKASEARDEYDALAREPEEHEPILLLGAYFTLRRGDVQAAARAVRELREDPGSDARGLYVQIVVLDAAGEKDAAAALRKRLENTVTLLTPLLLRAVDGASEGSSSAR